MADQPDEPVNVTDLPLSSRSNVPMEVQDATASTSATPFAGPTIAAPKSNAQRQLEYRQRIAASRTSAQATAARKLNTERRQKSRLRTAANLANLALASGLVESNTASFSRSGERPSNVRTGTQQHHTMSHQPDEPVDLTDLPLPSTSNVSMEVQAAAASTSTTPFAETTIAAPKSNAQKQREYRQRIAASRTPAQAAAARKSDTKRRQNSRLRSASNLANLALASGSVEPTTASSSRSRERSNNIQTGIQRQLTYQQRQTLAAEPAQTTVQPDEYDSELKGVCYWKMQLIPDVVKEARMSETDIMKMESSNVEKDTTETSNANDVEPLGKDGAHSCSAKNVMVVIDDSCLNPEINSQSKNTSVLRKELLEILNNGENENISPNQDNANVYKVKIDCNDSEETPDIVLKDQTDTSKTLNGIVKLEPVEDLDMPDAPIDTPNVNGKTQDVVSKNNETHVEAANGIVQPIQVKEEINPPVVPLPILIKTVKPEPVANYILPLPILIDTVKPEPPVSITEASEKTQNNSKEEADNEIPDKIMTESHSTEIKATNINKTPCDSNVETQKDDLATEKSSVIEVIKPVDTINNESSEDSSNSCAVEKPMTPTLNENSNSSVGISEKCDTLDVIENSTAIVDTLNLDSDDEMDGKEKDKEKNPPSTAEPKECVSVNLDDDDDDDIMLVDDDPKEPVTTDRPKEIVKTKQDSTTLSQNNESQIPGSSDEKVLLKEKVDLNIEDDDIVLVNEDKTAASEDSKKENKLDSTNDMKPISEVILNKRSSISTPEKEQHKTAIDDLLKSPKPDITSDKKIVSELPTLPLDFKISFKNNIGELSRDDLEEFCLVKIVEAIVARSNLSDVRLKLKMLQKNIEEWRKKVNDLTKQNKDLDTVVKAVSDLQKRNNEERPVPIKITRSVGLQVGFTCHPSLKPSETLVKPPAAATAKKTKQPKAPSSKTPTPVFSTTPAVKFANNQTSQKKITPVPVPRLVLATKSPVKTNDKTPSPANSSPVTPTPAANMNLLKTALNTSTNSDNRKPSAEKRPAVQSIDLTDDEPPAKQQDVRTFQSKVGNGPGRPPNRGNTVTKLLQPVNRVSFIGNTTLMPANRPMYIPINANNAQQQSNIGPNTTIIGPRKIGPALNRQHTLVRVPGNNPIRLGHSITMMAPPVNMCHPAPLPHSHSTKMSHPTWKWIPPRPRLTISKTDNGIVISWEMDGYLDSKHEEVASYQIYAYQETSTPPNTDLWKKIGDVKSLPLPMACTLTKFMAGFKYYFAVRAVDVRSRVGPFSAPGQILLVNDK